MLSDDRNEAVREAVTKSLALVVAFIENVDKYEQVGRTYIFRLWANMMFNTEQRKSLSPLSKWCLSPSKLISITFLLLYLWFIKQSGHERKCKRKKETWRRSRAWSSTHCTVKMLGECLNSLQPVQQGVQTLTWTQRVASNIAGSSWTNKLDLFWNGVRIVLRQPGVPTWSWTGLFFMPLEKKIKTSSLTRAESGDPGWSIIMLTAAGLAQSVERLTAAGRSGGRRFDSRDLINT